MQHTLCYPISFPTDSWLSNIKHKHMKKARTRELFHVFIRETMVSCVLPWAHTSDYRQKLCAFVPFNRPNRPRAQELKPIKPLGTRQNGKFDLQNRSEIPQRWHKCCREALKRCPYLTSRAEALLNGMHKSAVKLL